MKRSAPAALLLALAVGASVAGQDRAAPVVTSLTLFAGTEGGLWLSTDWGQRWERARGAVEGDSLKGAGAVLSILPLGSRVYLGTSSGLLVSDDFGRLWKRGDLPTPVLAVLPSRYPQADPTVFAGTAEGLLRSPDGGRTFGPSGLMGTPVTRIEWPGPALVVASGRGVLVSTDAGTHFSKVGEGLPEGPAAALALSSYFAADPVLFASVGSSGVHRSGDGGRTWSPAGLSGYAVTDLVWLGPLLYAATDHGLFRSEDSARSWSRLGEGLGEAVPVRLLFPLAPESGAEIFLATDRGLYRSADGGHRWTLSGLAGEEVLAVATFPPPPRIVDPRRRRRR